LFALLLVTVTFGQEPGEVGKLIDQLGSDDAGKRKEAATKLEQIGEPALELLRKAAKDHADPDVQLRARLVLSTVERLVKGGEIRALTGHNGWVFRQVLTPDGKQAITCGDAIRVWDLEKGQEVRSFASGRTGWGMSLSPDGKTLLCTGYDRVARVWDLATGKDLVQLTGHTNEIWGAVFTADGKQVITGSWDKTVRVWDVATGREVRSLQGVKELPRCLALSPDGKQLVVGHNGTDIKMAATIGVWDLATGKEVRTFKGHEGGVTQVGFSPDGKQLVSSSFDKTVRLWDFASGKELLKIEASPTGVDGVAFTPDGKRLVTTGWDGDSSVRVWDATNGRPIAKFDGHTQPAISVTVLPDGKRALTSGKDGTLRLWQLPK
jgi:WD40 repeat protein